MNPNVQKAVRKLTAHLTEDPETGCWNWSGTTVGGYGLITINGKRIRAHRLSYILGRGPIPRAVDVHHRCRNPKCCNWKHMEALTRSEHARLHSVAMTPQEREKLSEAARDAALSLEGRERTRKAQEKAWATRRSEETKKRLAERAKKMWAPGGALYNRRRKTEE
jgi:hypothetical protein